MSSEPKTSPARLDVTGHKCPLPVLRVRRMLEKMKGGDILRVTATDPMTQIDFPYFCQQAGHDLLDMTIKDEIYYFLIKKAGG